MTARTASVPTKRRWHTPMERCAFCQQVERLYEMDDHGERERLLTELFDQAERANHARRAYGRRHGYTR